ncbi:hypothetical protein K438DRAFT_1785707 [Mycena galopus ATCC 62051]|nr:hypothetical protein K438DRAFT_1785707 [Mycena galopus ATCC 62051]
MVTLLGLPLISWTGVMMVELTKNSTDKRKRFTIPTNERSTSHVAPPNSETLAEVHVREAWWHQLDIGNLGDVETLVRYGPMCFPASICGPMDRRSIVGTIKQESYPRRPIVLGRGLPPQEGARFVNVVLKHLRVQGELMLYLIWLISELVSVVQTPAVLDTVYLHLILSPTLGVSGAVLSERKRSMSAMFPDTIRIRPPDPRDGRIWTLDSYCVGNLCRTLTIDGTADTTSDIVRISEHSRPLHSRNIRRYTYPHHLEGIEQHSAVNRQMFGGIRQKMMGKQQWDHRPNTHLQK